MKNKISGFLKDYFLEGQFRTEKQKPQGGWLGFYDTWFYHTFIFQRPRLVAIFLPLTIVWTGWLIVAFTADLWHLFEEKYFMTITMFFGSLIAGGTSEGGASVAFPIMTLVFDISPSVARDFSLMIQTFGMTAASFTLLYMRIRVEYNALLYATIGGFFGMSFSVSHVIGNIPPAWTKMVFVSVWFGFAASLFWLNRIHGRHVHLEIQSFTHWKAVVLMIFGFVGGLLSAIAGSGIDICIFSCLTLLFRVSEKVATPTSVILMAINTTFGFFFKWAFYGMEPEAFEFLFVCVPIVVVGAPLGGFLSSFVHRIIYSFFIYVTDTAQFVAALVIVEQTMATIVFTIVTVIVSVIFFFFLMRWGEKMLQKDLENSRLVEGDESYEKVNLQNENYVFSLQHDFT